MLPDCGICNNTRTVATDVYLNDKQVLAEAVQCCRRRLIAEAVHIQPKVIVPLGRFALETFIGKSAGILKHRGAIHTVNVELGEARA